MMGYVNDVLGRLLEQARERHEKNVRDWERLKEAAIVQSGKASHADYVAELARSTMQFSYGHLCALEEAKHVEEIRAKRRYK